MAYIKVEVPDGDRCNNCMFLLKDTLGCQLFDMLLEKTTDNTGFKKCGQCIEESISEDSEITTMDAVKFLQEKNRMCETYGTCEGCPLWYVDDTCTPIAKYNPKVFVEAVKKWSEENPPRTLLDLFKEQHPNAPLGRKGTPFTCPYFLGYTSKKDDMSICEDSSYSDKCVVCWNRPAKEQ